jgi:hypothetical protein
MSFVADMISAAPLSNSDEQRCRGEEDDSLLREEAAKFPNNDASQARRDIEGNHGRARLVLH